MLRSSSRCSLVIEVLTEVVVVLMIQSFLCPVNIQKRVKPQTVLHDQVFRKTKKLSGLNSRSLYATPSRTVASCPHHKGHILRHRLRHSFSAVRCKYTRSKELSVLHDTRRLIPYRKPSRHVHSNFHWNS
jgi:hypothetical protein